MKAKAKPLLLDTHIWVDYIHGAGLRAELVRKIEDARLSGVLYVSVISVWELALLVRKGRLHLPLGVHVWIERALELPGLHLLPLSPDMAIESVDLADGFHKDPADRILVASARVENLVLVTRDNAILRFAQSTALQHQKA